MATIRLIEVIVFERRIKMKRRWARARDNRIAINRFNQNRNYASDDYDAEMTLTTTIDRESGHSTEEKEHQPLNEPSYDESDALNNTLTMSRRIAILRHHPIDENKEYDSEFDEERDSSVFVYGNEEPQTSLSNMFAASTKFMSSGVFGKISEDDVCFYILCGFELDSLM